MSINDEQPCMGKPERLMEQFIPDHVFLYVTKGTIFCYDGNKSYTLKEGEYGLMRKNYLARYYSEKGSPFERIIFCFEEAFIRSFQEKYKLTIKPYSHTEAYVRITPNDMIPAFIASLKPYTNNAGKIDAAFEDMKYEELLMILLQQQPELTGLFFDYAQPGKINLEEFMHRNYKFNVNIDRFAYLTGRSLSAFKRDFKAIFNDTPNQWLVKRRLQEAYILIEQNNKKASEIYVELGFEDLSHFSYAFKKLFGLRPTEVTARMKHNASY